MESWPGLIAEVKHRMQLSPTSVFMHYMPFCSADHGRGQSNGGKERRIIYFISGGGAKLSSPLFDICYAASPLILRNEKIFSVRFAMELSIVVLQELFRSYCFTSDVTNERTFSIMLIASFVNRIIYLY